ncbi:MAG: hypothetical protein N2Z85_02525 [Patescibacteria group bacterium]|nr:hypothetical protein [Patescibacteria group bacterium]
MKSKLSFILILSLLIPTYLFSQNVNMNKKALDAFISSTTKSILGEPIPNATIVYEQVKPELNVNQKEKNIFDVIKKNKTTTNSKGEFKVEISNEQFEKLPEDFQLKFTITPKDVKKYSVLTNIVLMETNKENGPFNFILTYQKDKETNKGAFIISPKIEIED